MTTYLVTGLLAFTVVVMVLFSLGNTKGRSKYIFGLGLMATICAGVAIFEKDRVAASMLELSVLLASIFLGVLVSKNVLDKSSSYVDELFKDEDKGKPEPEPEEQTAEEQPQPKPSSESTNEKYVDLLKKAAKLSIFAVPFLLIVNISMQLILPVVKADDNSVIEHLGTFGDFFGGTLNPVLTFATFIALIATILIQLKELRLTREELKNSNKMLEMSQKEQAKTAKALQEQERTQRLQQFENTFFSLLDRVVVEQDKYEKLFEDAINSNLQKIKQEDSHCSYVEGVVNFNSKLMRFLILLYQLIRFVNLYKYSGFNEEMVSDNRFSIEGFEKGMAEHRATKKRFFNIIRSSVSHDVLYMIFLACSDYNESVGVGFSKYKFLVNKYSFFEHLDFNEFYYNRGAIALPKGPDALEREQRLHNLMNNRLAEIHRGVAQNYNGAFGDSVYWKKLIDAP